MQVLYVDVYFFINFTVNLLALYFSARFLHIRTGIIRLLICSTLGASCALIDVFLYGNVWLRGGNILLFLVLIFLFSASHIGFGRRIKLVFAFVICEITLAGLVYFGYSLLDRIFDKYTPQVYGGSENHAALVFSLIILFSMGVLRLVLMLFSRSGNEKNIRIRIKAGNITVESEALVDSGNLVRDPMSMRPVLFIKRELAAKLLPKNVTELCELDALSNEYKRRIRLIPVSKFGETHVMTGFKPDYVLVYHGKWEEMDFILAIDKEGGTYGGYEALAPSAAIDNVC